MKKYIFLLLAILPMICPAQIVNVSSMQAPGAPVPTITTSTTSLSTPFTTAQGTASGSQNFSTSASNLTAGVVVTAGSGYEVSLDNSSFAGTKTISITLGGYSGQLVYVRLAAATGVGTYNNNVTLTSGAVTKTVSVTGTVTSTSPTLTVTGTFSPFNTTAGIASTAQTVTVSSANLTASCVVTPPSPLLASLDGSTYGSTQTITQSGGLLAGQPVTVFVKVPSSASAGTISGNVTFTSTGATTISQAVSGTISSAGGSNDTTDVNIWDSVNNVGKVTSPATWNNWGLTEVHNIISQVFKNHAGTTLPIQLQFDAINALIDNGSGYNGSTTSGYPVLSFREAVFNNTSSNSLTITGLGAPTNGVKLIIGCSHVNTGTATRHVTFAVGAVTQTVNAIGNDVNVVLDNLTPSSGTIVVAITDDTGFWYVDWITIIKKN